MCQCVVFHEITDVYVSLEGRPGDQSSAFMASLLDRIDASNNGSRLVRTTFSTGDPMERHVARCVAMAEQEAADASKWEGGGEYFAATLFTAEGACTLAGGRFVFPESMADADTFVPAGCRGVAISSFRGMAEYVRDADGMRTAYFQCALVAPTGEPGKEEEGVPETSHVLAPAYRAAAFQGISPSSGAMEVAGWVNEGFPDALQGALDAMPEGPLTVVELGTWMGMSTNMIAKAVKARGERHAGSVVVAVDTWLGSAEHLTTMPEHAKHLARDNGYPRLYRTFLQHTKNARNHDMIAPLPLPTQQAIFVLEHQGAYADIIYVDAAHDEEAVYADVRAYWRILKPGTGWMIGDDWAWDGVRRAVERFAGERGLEVHSDRGVWWLCNLELS